MVARTQSEAQARIPATKKITGSPFDPLVKALFPKLASITPEWVTPNLITKLGLFSSFATGVAVAFARFSPELLIVGCGFVLLNWITDTLDGVLARQRNQCSRLGDFYDHVFDAFMVALVNIGLAFSGLCHPVLPLMLGVVFLLNFAITYKGEQVTGVYELLTFGPTEVRFGIIFFLTMAYLFPGTIVTSLGWDLQVIDLGLVFGISWSIIYILVLFRRYTTRIRDAEE